MKLRLICTAAMAIFVSAAQSLPCQAAGDVTAELVDGTLLILGDAEDNEVRVTGDLDALSLSISGDLAVSFPLGDVGAVLINSGGGNDLVFLAGTIPGDVIISSGAGWDTVGTMLGSSTTVLGNLYIESGQGYDDIVVWSLAVTGALDISTGHGSDDIWLKGSIEIGGNLHINTGVHKDHVMIDGLVTVDGDLLLQLGQADDFLRLHGAPYPRLLVGGSASLYGDQGVDLIYRTYPLEMLIVAGVGVEIVGFE
jgi:hypothetical protein